MAARGTFHSSWYGDNTPNGGADGSKRARSLGAAPGNSCTGRAACKGAPGRAEGRNGSFGLVCEGGKLRVYACKMEEPDWKLVDPLFFKDSIHFIHSLPSHSPYRRRVHWQVRGRW